VAPSALATRRDRLDGLGENVALEISAAMAMRKPPMSCASSGVTGSAGRVCTPHFGIRPLHRVIGQRQIVDIARERPEMIEARDERERPRTRTAVHRSAFSPKIPQNDDGTRIEPFGIRPQCQRHQAPPTAAPEPPTSRRSSASHHAGCATDRRAHSRR